MVAWNLKEKGAAVGNDCLSLSLLKSKKKSPEIVCIPQDDYEAIIRMLERRMKGSMKRGQAFYQSKGWARKRAAVLRRDRYQCQEAKRYGEYREAVTVHHIYPLTEYPEFALESWNLISLSNEYHNRMHDRNTGKITNAGKYWQRKRWKQFEEYKKRHPPPRRNPK